VQIRLEKETAPALVASFPERIVDFRAFSNALSFSQQYRPESAFLRKSHNMHAGTDSLLRARNPRADLLGKKDIAAEAAGKEEAGCNTI